MSWSVNDTVPQASIFNHAQLRNSFDRLGIFRDKMVIIWNAICGSVSWSHTCPVKWDISTGFLQYHIAWTVLRLSMPRDSNSGTRTSDVCLLAGFRSSCLYGKWDISFAGFLPASADVWYCTNLNCPGLSHRRGFWSPYPGHTVPDFRHLAQPGSAESQTSRFRRHSQQCLFACAFLGLMVR